MGNCHCRPREGGESLRGFLSRKFHKVSEKRKIDDLVTMAIQDEREKSNVKKGAEETVKAGEVEDHNEEMELEDLEYDTVSDDESCPDSDGRTSPNQEHLVQSQMSDNRTASTQEHQVKSQMSDKRTSSTQEHLVKSRMSDKRTSSTQEHLVKSRMSDNRTSSTQEHLVKSQMSDRTTSSIKDPMEKSQMSDDLNKKTEQECDGKSSSQEVTEYKEDNDYIRVLQQQLKQVQNELASLQRGTSSRGQSKVTVREDQGGSCSAYSFQSQQPVEVEEVNVEPRCEIESPVETFSYITPRLTYLHAHGDTRSSTEKQLKDKQLDNVSAAGEKPAANLRTAEIEEDHRGETKDKDDIISHKDGRSSKMNGMVTEGLRTRTYVKLPRNKAQVTTKETLQKTKIEKDKNVVEDKTRTAKIAALQQRDPTLPRPDKGIVWPKTMENLSKDDKAYYVEQFLRSELFRQRCLRKYQGSKTWMNGLTPFHLWILENEGTDELEAVLHPLPKRQNNAQAKVRCWRGNTPPPPPPTSP